MSGPQHTPKESVVLLHGLARTKGSMEKMESALNLAGYHTVNQGYPSTRHDIQTLAELALEQALPLCPPDHRIHFVTHSMGGILLRQYLSQNPVPNLGRVVMLGPPNQGSQVVDRLKGIPGFRAINGPAGIQLGTTPASVPIRLGAAAFEVGIIAGSRSVNPILSLMLPKPDDGKVSVRNTRLDGMSDHITLPVTHPFMMRNPSVIRQTLHFLRYGTFTHTDR